MADPVLTQLQDTLRDDRRKLDDLGASLAATRVQIRNFAEKLDKEEKTRPVFPEFVKGKITRYRYGAFSDDPGPAGETVTHRFDLDTDDGVVLHIVVPSPIWDKFVAASGVQIAASLEDTWNGMDINVVRDGAGRYYPAIPEVSPEIPFEGDPDTPLIKVAPGTSNLGFKGSIFPGDKVIFEPGSAGYSTGKTVTGIAINTDKRGSLQAFVERPDRFKPNGDMMGDKKLFRVRKKFIASVVPKGQ